MDNPTPNPAERIAIAVGLLVAVVLGLVGTALGGAGPAAILAYAASSLGLILGAGLIAARLARAGHDAQAVGFGVLALGEAVMLGGLAAPPAAANAAFGAGMALYVLALLLVSAPRSSLARWARVAGALAAVPFGAAAALVFAGQVVPATATLPGIGYGLLSVAAIGWILRSWRGNAPAPTTRASPA